MTRKAHYALLALAEMARNGKGVVSAGDLGRKFDLPVSALANVLNQLKNSGLVQSKRGAAGGYRLARPAGDIQLGQLIEAIDGEFKLSKCCPDRDGCIDSVCAREDICPINDPVRDLNSALRGIMSRVTLAHFADGSIPQVLQYAADSKQPVHGSSQAPAPPVDSAGK